MSSNETTQSLLDPKEDTEAANAVQVEVLTEKLPEIQVNIKLPVISSNFELFKQKLEIKLEQFNLKVDEKNVDLANDMAKTLNKLANQILDLKQEKVKFLSTPIDAFKSNCDSMVVLVKNKRQILLDQVKVYEDIERAECLELLKKELALQYVKFGVKVEYQSVKVDDLAIISNKTPTGGLKKPARDAVEKRTLDRKRFQERIEFRLTTLEGTCLKAGLEAPLTRELIEGFLKESDDDLYEKKLSFLIGSEIKRLAAMKAKIEQNAQVEAEAKAKAQHEAQPQPTTHVNQKQTTTNTVSQVSQQNAQPTPQHKTSIELTGNVKKYVVTAVFEVEVDEAYEPYLKGQLLKKFDQARITTLPEISIAEKQEVSQVNVQSGPQKEGSDF